MDQQAPKVSALDRQPGGTHYKQMAIQPIQFIQANGLGFCEGNVIKYVSRWRAKGGVADLEKAKHYIDLLIEFAGKDASAEHYTDLFEKAAKYRAEEEKARKEVENHRNVLAGAHTARFPRVDPATLFNTQGVTTAVRAPDVAPVLFDRVTTLAEQKATWEQPR